MDTRAYLGHYLRSPLGMAATAGSLVLTFLLFRALGPALAVLCGVGLWSAAFVAGLLSGAGPKAAQSERERADWKKAQAYLAGADAMARRLSSVRMPDPELRPLVELLGMRARAYMEAARREKTRDPKAEDAIAEGLDVINLYLRELDDASTERRYELADDDRVPEAQARVAGLLRDKAAQLERATEDISGRLHRDDGLSIKETV
ncbi:MAG: hypothetical protein KBB32_00025 [Spirochaetia bacterium]|nr:hypothetical protein [Spirochaetia bacterium]